MKHFLHFDHHVKLKWLWLNCGFQVHENEDRLLGVKLRSDRVSSMSDLVWIRFTESNVVACYCKC